jgi:hypothetical protein
MSSARLRTVALLVKALVVVLVLWAVADPDLAGLKSKGLSARAVGYPLGTLVLPALWWLGPRRHGRPYGWGADLLCGLPILLDLVGNRLDLYDAVSWWDDLMHLGLHALLTAGVLVQLLDRTTPARWLLTAAAAVGGVSAIGWEVAEYLAFIRFGTELPWAYVDTLGDLVLGTTGSLAAGVVIVLVRRRPGVMASETGTATARYVASRR